MSASHERVLAALEIREPDRVPTMDVMEEFAKFAEDSIYDENYRLAMPDEVWNYKRGDGLEKIILLAGFIYNKAINENNGNIRKIVISVKNGKAYLSSGDIEAAFETEKDFEGIEWVIDV